MCGIAGIVGTLASSSEELRGRTQAMTDRIRYRGPNDAGLWSQATCRVVLGHRRLSIIDLSPAGHQPMPSGRGDQVIAFNGEVYNFPAIRQEIEAGEAVAWRGHSDTEVMVEAVSRWGIHAALRRFNGMFALAVVDTGTGRLTLARDRFGVKPLYVGRSGDGALLFCSEAGGLAADPQFPAHLNRGALAGFFAHGYIARSQCIYADMFALAPGSWLELAADAAVVDWADLLASARQYPEGPFDLTGLGWRYRSYWSAQESFLAGEAAPFFGSFDDAIERLELLLDDAVQQRMVADVPLGALLSGGVDSSLVVALMQRRSSRKVRTFSIGFEDSGFDESGHAEAVARHLGTDHTTLRIGSEEAVRAAAAIGKLQDEPLADSSFVPTYVVSELTRRHVTVAMTGDGGDELFGGYWRYREFRRLGLAYKLPSWLRRAGDSVGQAMETPMPQGRGMGWAWYRAARLLRLSAQPDFTAAYRYATTSVMTPEHLLIGYTPLPPPRSPVLTSHNRDAGRWMMHHDVLRYLPDNLLVKMDRASMRVSLETREPLLDYRLHELATQLPVGFMLEPGAGKRILREVLYRHVPRELIDRPKQGFAVPLQRWLREDLRACVEQALFSPSAADELLRMEEIRRLWGEHQEGRWNHSGVIWTTFVLKQWLAKNRWN